ncbi:4-hydroxy-tetrahydrodipicolinate reductase [Mesonia ostreae]|uniref:4-hydroxy-tetrahydrodipicolinate reductase n=1 Tax=Mesonia ostreae TaxID=861110 RepID=A0ABU2KLM0_9FLAO|nr:4-hydroxy-tetrahydrodipicolinate reductase [Mesonia ostreae]MDT0295620.1 4-hydroxy-tetrahydrodipicolinate reductase [Mesonia ostreae]
MKIALLGYGKMGKTIEKLALERNHSICYKTSSEIDVEQLKQADVAIDFSIPTAAKENIITALKAQIPVISGTTGWLNHYEEVVKICEQENGTFLYASNFSLGVNLFFNLNAHLAKLMNGHKQYQVGLEEIHHTQKLDAPSGTAISLAKDIIDYSSLKDWKLVNENEESEAESIPVTAKRIENISGTHSITYSSSVDDIEIKHTAHSREGFALGAIIAAEWIKDKKGVFSMKDVLNLNNL